MPGLTLVVLAGGLGSRFGGAKQLAPVGPEGEAIVDYTVSAARRAGFDDVVLVVRTPIASAVQAHVDAFWPDSLRRTMVCQDADPQSLAAAAQGRQKPLGTAHAVACAAPYIAGAFAVINADDLYGDEAFGPLAAQLASHPESGVLVGFEVARTLLGDLPVRRALCSATVDGWLESIEEGTVGPPGQGHGRVWTGMSGREIVLAGNEVVSMNMWGFPQRALETLLSACDAFIAAGGAGTDQEVLLPDVVARLMDPPSPIPFAIQRTMASCLGLTHPDDLDGLRPRIRGRAW